MASTKLTTKSLTHDPSHYAKTFSVYARLSAKYQVLATWTDTVFPSEVVEKLSPVSNEEGKLKILGIGSGTGGMDCNMITQLLKKFPTISNTVLEPAADHIEGYKKLLESKGFGSDVDFNWRQQTWDEYYKECQQVNEIKKFHFISAIHSLYYVEDLESTILDLIDCLEEGGVLLMIAVSDDSGFWRLWKRFPMFADDLYRQINSGDIRRILDTHQIEYKAITQESRVDITCCYEDGNQDGVLLTDFLNHVVNLRECSSQSFVDEVLSYMRGEDCTVQNGDQLLFNNDWQAIIVTK